MDLSKLDPAYVNPILEITDRTPFGGGLSFGAAGEYERLRARVHYVVDPRPPLSDVIEDLDLAPRDTNGRVRFSSDVIIFKPIQLERGNGRLLFDFPNRGNLRSLQFFNDAPANNDPRTAVDAGNGFLMRRGYVVVAAGWQADVLPGDHRLTLNAPLAGDPTRPVTGRVAAEFIVDRPGIFTLPLSGRVATRSNPTASLDQQAATLTRRRYPGSRRVTISSHAWRFARVEGGGRENSVEGDGKNSEVAIIPSHSHVHLDDGFDPGWIYELVYEACAPLVLGVGFLAVRDLVSFLRTDRTPDNPLHSPHRGIEKAYAWGRSQSGRCVRDFIYRGFNADTSGNRVFEGAMTHIAGAGRMAIGRFSNLVIASSRQYEDHDNSADAFPFSYAESTDHVTGQCDAILKRPSTDPLVLHTQTATEYWQRRGSLVHTDTRGGDLEQPSTVRVYTWASSQHWADPNMTTPSRGVCDNLINIVSTSMFFRAHLEALDEWASGGRAPPASRIPRRADGTLVSYAEWRKQFPAIPGVRVPYAPNELPIVPTIASSAGDDGAAVQDGYAILVPAVDGDGNDVAGIRAPMVAAPLGTYTGWNLRSRGSGDGALHDFSGSYIPFPDSTEEAEVTGDSRASVLSRYPDVHAYVAAIRSAAEKLRDERLLLDEDVERASQEALDWGRPQHDVRLSRAPDDTLANQSNCADPASVRRARRGEGHGS